MRLVGKLFGIYSVVALCEFRLVCRILGVLSSMSQYNRVRISQKGPSGILAVFIKVLKTSKISIVCIF